MDMSLNRMTIYAAKKKHGLLLINETYGHGKRSEYTFAIGRQLQQIQTCALVKIKLTTFKWSDFTGGAGYSRAKLVLQKKLTQHPK